MPDLIGTALILVRPEGVSDFLGLPMLQTPGDSDFIVPQMGHTFKPPGDRGPRFLDHLDSDPCRGKFGVSSSL